jgi:hypothetical protein
MHDTVDAVDSAGDRARQAPVVSNVSIVSEGAGVRDRVYVRPDWPPGSNAVLAARQVRCATGFTWKPPHE